MWLPRLLQPEPAPLEIAVHGAELTVGGRRMPLPGDRRALIRLFGEPSFVLELENTLSVWDNLGLVAYQPPGGGPVLALSVILGELTGHGFWPRRPFPGRLTLDGATVTTHATIDGINAAKTGARLAPAGGGCCWEIDHGSIVVAVNTAQDGHFEVGGAVAELAITARPAEPAAAPDRGGTG
jgi:hypothetical protein